MIGSKIAHYEILSLLGKGGMGEVYRAYDPMLRRDVALKVLKSEGANSSVLLARFEQEARLASSLNHPNIVTIYGVGREGSTAYIAMELVEGRTLAEALTDGSMTLAEVLAIAPQIADGLSRAHAIGIVHRDLKPQNLMINRDGLVKILDFGLGKVILPADDQTTLGDDNSTPRTGSGVIVGTIGYMSPEQASGKPLDFRSDQFSFGTILYEMLTGQRPFERATAVQTMSAIIESDPVPASELNPKTPPECEKVLKRCLAKKPENRFASTMDLAAELRAVKDSQPAGHARIMPRLRRIARRRSVQVGAAVALVAASIAIGSVLLRSHSSDFELGPMPAMKRVVILPLTNLDGDPANQQFIDGLNDAMTSRLTQIEQFQSSLQVIPISEIQKYAVSTAHAAAQTFGATIVADGSFQKMPDGTRITLNVVDTHDARSRRSRTIDVPNRDTANLEDKLAVSAAEMMGITLSDRAVTALNGGTTASTDAFKAYIEGRGYLYHFHKKENLDNAIRLFKTAIERDPQYALASSSLCEAYWRKYDDNNGPKDASLIAMAKDNCERAQAINDKLAPVHLTLAILNNGIGNFEEGLKEAERALQLDPINASAIREVASANQGLGNNELAEAAFKKAIELRPNDYQSYSQLGVYYYGKGRYTDAADEFRQVVRLTPDNSRAYSNLGAIYLYLKRYDDAIDTLQKSLDLEPTMSAYQNLGAIYYAQGHYTDAVAALEKAVKLNDQSAPAWRSLANAYMYVPNMREKARGAYLHVIELGEKQRLVTPKDSTLLKNLAESYYMTGDASKGEATLQLAIQADPTNVNVMETAAVLYEYSGNREKALEWVGKALRDGLPFEKLDQDPGLTALRADPRFQALRDH